MNLTEIISGIGLTVMLASGCPSAHIANVKPELYLCHIDDKEFYIDMARSEVEEEPPYYLQVLNPDTGKMVRMNPQILLRSCDYLLSQKFHPEDQLED